MRSELSLRTGDLARAEAEARAVLRITERSVAAAACLADALVERGRFDDDAELRECGRRSPCGRADGMVGIASHTDWRSR